MKHVTPPPRAAPAAGTARNGENRYGRHLKKSYFTAESEPEKANPRLVQPRRKGSGKKNELLLSRRRLL